MAHRDATVLPLLIIGAGISGLSCAYALRQAGFDPLVLESADQPGGVIHSVRRDGYLVERGPQSFSATASLRRLCAELGIADQVVPAPSRAPRFLLIHGRLQRVPLSPPAFFASPLFSLATKWSILRDAVGRRTPPSGEESVAGFVRRKFSAELLDKLAGPLISGIYAGNPEKLSLRAAFPQIFAAEMASGSIIRGMIRAAKARPGARERSALLSFREGNETLVRALVGSLGSAVRTNTIARAIRRGSDPAVPNERWYEVETECRGDRQTFSAKSVVIAAPASTAGDLVADLAPSAADALRAIEYAPVAVVALGYPAGNVGHSLSGFGFLIPRSAGQLTLGTVWNSSLFPGRAPRGHVLLTSFVGGAMEPGAALLPAEELAAVVHRELTPVLGISAPPAFSEVTRWERAIPQYNLGHSARLAAVSSALEPLRGLFLTGNYFTGPAIGACVDHAQSIAARVRASQT